MFSLGLSLDVSTGLRLDGSSCCLGVPLFRMYLHVISSFALISTFKGTSFQSISTFSISKVSLTNFKIWSCERKWHKNLTRLTFFTAYYNRTGNVFGCVCLSVNAIRFECLAEAAYLCQAVRNVNSVSQVRLTRDRNKLKVTAIKIVYF